MRVHARRVRCFRLEGIKIPESVIRERSRRYVTMQTISKGAFLYWPDGHPCIPVNQYLVEQAYEWTGASAQTYAYKLARLVSYCGVRGKSFGELSDGDIRIFITELMEDTLSNGWDRRRNNNSVREIIHRCLCFLRWFQESLHWGPEPLIGVSGDSAAITVTERWNPDSRRMEWGHRYLPETVSTDPKLPISLPAIQALEGAIESKGVYEQTHERIRRAHGRDEKFTRDWVDYLWARRRFLVWLLQTTGMRPSEMMALRVRDFEAILSSKKDGKGVVHIPTLKRRRNDPPTRAFVLYGAQLEFVRRYLIARRSWVDACERHHACVDSGGAVFLGAGPKNLGLPVSLSALAKDFDELRQEAGLHDQQLCFSMFRHRFITQEVRKLLREFKLNNGAVISDADYRGLLERVRLKTGHGNVMSLWHYIDLARNDDGLWDSLETLEERNARCDGLNEELAALKRAMAAGTVDVGTAMTKLEQLVRQISMLSHH